MNPERNRNNVEHIFGGVPEYIFDPNATPKENLERLRPNFTRLGIVIDSNCTIANSTLQILIEKINNIVSPARQLDPEISRGLDAIFGENAMVGVPESTQKVFDENARSKNELDLNIKICHGVKIGEGVGLDSSISIGEQTHIGNLVVINTGTKIGKHCRVGNYVFFNLDCLIGDGVEIEDKTVFKPKTQVPANSRVVHESDDSAVAKIERKLKLI